MAVDIGGRDVFAGLAGLKRAVRKLTDDVAETRRRLAALERAAWPDRPRCARCERELAQAVTGHWWCPGCGHLSDQAT